MVILSFTEKSCIPKQVKTKPVGRYFVNGSIHIALSIKPCCKLCKEQAAILPPSVSSKSLEAAWSFQVFHLEIIFQCHQYSCLLANKIHNENSLMKILVFVVGQIIYIYAIRIYFPIDNPQIILTPYFIPSSLLLTSVGHPSGSYSLDS